MRLPLLNLKCNSCDGLYNSMDIHFTSNCCNLCPYCIDFDNRNQKKCPPDVEAIVETIVKNQEGLNDVLFLGGEPCLYLDELLECVRQIKARTRLKVYITSSVPYICYINKDKFYSLLDLIDGLNISAQHYNEKIADKIRGHTTPFDRQSFYNSLPYKEKIRININIVRHYLDSRDDILKCIHHYDKMNFGGILIRELQHSPEYFVSFENIMKIKLPSPYAHGCQTNIIIPGEEFKTPIILKRSCSLVEESLNANWEDILKSIIKIFKSPPCNKFGVVWEDGSLRERW